MDCPNCGQQTSGQFCGRCGADLRNVAVASSAATVASPESDATTVLSPSAIALASRPYAPPVSMPISVYPVTVEYDRLSGNNRFWAIPVVGYLIKSIILIPHYVVLVALFLAVGVLQFVLWIPVLMSGRYPDWAFSIVGGAIRWHTNVIAYFFGLTDEYPPFSMTAGTPDGPSYPVHVMIERPTSAGRFWAVPLLGFVARAVMLVPHLIILYALGAIVSLMQLILWAPVLFTGRYPSWGYDLVGGYFRWYVRVSAFVLGLTDRYPPFQMA